MNCKSPVTVIIFNRSDTIDYVFNSIREYKPDEVFIIADGPRNEKKEDQEQCRIVRQKVEKLIDWECEVHRNYTDLNIGLGQRIRSGLDWVFSIVDSSIILEDDCVATLPFYFFCEELLKKYCNDKRIMHISGTNYTPESNPDFGSYFFSKYGHIWGWATWARAWTLMDYDMKYWDNLRKRQTLKSIFSLKEYNYFVKIFNSYFYDNNKPWGQRWFYSRMVNSGLSIIPAKNLVSNIGISGTNSDKKNWAHFQDVDSSFKITSHPGFIISDSKYDEYHFKNIIHRKKSLYHRILHKSIKIMRGK